MTQRHLFNSYNVSDEMLGAKHQDITLKNSDVLLNPYRIDLIAKHIYIDSKIYNRNIDFSKALYAAHIEAFTHGKFVEQGQEQGKNSLHNYYDVFDNLLEKIQSEGFDPEISRIPISEDGIILDGSHRVAICSYFSLPIEVSIFDVAAPIYDYSFFKRRMIEPMFLDFLVHRYVQTKAKNVYALCLWPIAYEYEGSITSILEENVTVAYKKEIYLNKQGAHCFVSQIYSHQEWVGTPKNGFIGARKKVLNCFNDQSPLIVFMLETKKSLFEILELKEKIREISALGNHSVHVTDNFKETEQISELLLNENTVYHLNHSNPFAFHEGIERLLALKNILINDNFDFGEIIIDGSIPMEIFGLRKADDVDFVSTQTIPNGDFYSRRKKEDIDKLYGNNIDRLQSPESYFYFFGFRFLTLEMILESKKRRGEKKDVLDASIIVQHLRRKSSNRFARVKFAFERKKMSWRRDLGIAARWMLRKLGLTNLIR